jgi:hypothetical protein
VTALRIADRRRAALRLASTKLVFNREIEMDNLTFGFTMLIVGMGGTLAALALLALVMGVLKKLFPVQEDSTN